MKALIKYLFALSFSFIVIVGIIYGIVYKLRDKRLPFQSRIDKIMHKEAIVDSSLITGIPTAEQLRAQDYEKRRIKLDRVGIKYENGRTKGCF